MNAWMMVNQSAKRIAGFAAIVATLFSLGGTLTLADHYARAYDDGQGYLAAIPATSQTAQVISRDEGRA